MSKYKSQRMNDFQMHMKHQSLSNAYRGQEKDKESKNERIILCTERKQGKQTNQKIKKTN